jgi:hypothetical protein
MAKNNNVPRQPGDRADADARAFRDQPGQPGPQVIGGSHNVSVRIDPQTALTGGYTPIPGDTMPADDCDNYLPSN